MNPALEKSLAKLTDVAGRLSRTSDALNQEIYELEKTLVGLNLGVTVWLDKVIHILPDTPSTYASQIGFTRIKDTWGIWLRRGAFVKDPEGWKPLPNVDWTFARLVNGTRQERAASVNEFPNLVELLTTTAEKQLASLEETAKGAR